jgi:glucose/arabinose dehydrogenase
LYIADVGQNQREEVNVGLAARRGGENWGWNIMEGTRCHRPTSGCNQSGLDMPVLEYDRSGGACAITGGIVYRGCRLPGYAGTYFFADYCNASIRSFRLEGGRAVDLRDWTSSLGRGVDSPTSFGVDADGEAYIVDRDGELYRIVPAG